MALIELFFKLSDKHLSMLKVWQFDLNDSDKNMLSKFGVNLTLWQPLNLYNLNLIEFTFRHKPNAISTEISTKLIKIHIKFIFNYRFDFFGF